MTRVCTVWPSRELLLFVSQELTTHQRSRNLQMTVFHAQEVTTVLVKDLLLHQESVQLDTTVSTVQLN